MLEDKIPKIFRDRDWHFICAECFNDTDNIGATKFCNHLGYKSGIFLRHDDDSNNDQTDLNGLENNGTNVNATSKAKTYSSEPIVFGKCETEDTWPLCTGICNPQKQNGTTNYQNCAIGNAALRIECSNSIEFFQNRTSSC